MTLWFANTSTAQNTSTTREHGSRTAIALLAVFHVAFTWSSDRTWTQTRDLLQATAYQCIPDWVQIANARACHRPHRTRHINIIPPVANFSGSPVGYTPEYKTLRLRTISSSTFANIVIISQQRIILHTDTNLTRAIFQHSQLRQIIFSLLSEMNIKVPLYHAALIKNHHISSTILPLTITVKYLFIYLHSNCQDVAAAVSHQPVDYVWFTGLTNSLTSVVTLAQGYSGDWWPCPHTLTQKHGQAHANTHADVFRQASLTTTQGHAHRSRQTQWVNSVGTRCDLKSSDWIRGKHCKREIGASVWSALEKKLQNKG